MIAAMAFNGPLEDRQLIAELHATYADASFAADRQGWLDCWSADPVWESSFGTFTGKTAMGEQWDRLWEAMTFLAFFSQTSAIEVTGDTATAHCHVREVFTLADGTRNEVIARYDDALVREGCGWKFARRSYTVLQR